MSKPKNYIFLLGLTVSVLLAATASASELSSLTVTTLQTSVSTLASFLLIWTIPVVVHLVTVKQRRDNSS
ncbi:MAG: hypothetical protein AAF438_18070 [Pseudomonadota bacterium]